MDGCFSVAVVEGMVCGANEVPALRKVSGRYCDNKFSFVEYKVGSEELYILGHFEDFHV
jgi:hypothetical protein